MSTSPSVLPAPVRPSSRGRAPHRRLGWLGAWALVIALLLVACLPSTDPRFDTARAQEVERAAQEAFHRMEIGRIRTGSYTLEPLVDVPLPQGARWSVFGTFTNDRYTLRFSSDLLPGIAWLVSPSGVRRVVDDG